jgi:DNA-binding transcriptional ArsR family regulator
VSFSIDRLTSLAGLLHVRTASASSGQCRAPVRLAISQPAISKHLRVLEHAGLISRGRDAQRRPCRIEGKPLAEATGWLEAYRQIWEGNFQRLDDLLAELKTRQKKRRHTKS